MRKRELQRMIDEPDNIEEERQQLQAELRESARKCSQTIQQFKVDASYTHFNTAG
jgi:hypothetical protein